MSHFAANSAARALLLLLVSVVLFVASISEVSDRLPSIIQYLNDRNVLSNLSASIFAAAVVLFFYELYAQEQFGIRLQKEITGAIMDPGNVLKNFPDEKVDDILTACLDRKFSANKLQADGLTRFLNKTLPLHRNAHYGMQWDISVLPHDEHYDLLDITLTFRKKSDRKNFSIRCTVEPNENHVRTYMDGANDFTWNFLAHGNDTIDESHFELTRLSIGRREIPVSRQQKKNESVDIQYQSDNFRSSDDKFINLIEEDDGTLLYRFSFRVRQSRRLSGVETSMRRACHGFKATLNYAQYPVDEVVFLSAMTCADFEDPFVSTNKAAKQISVEYFDWVFLGSSITFLWGGNTKPTYKDHKNGKEVKGVN